MGQLLGARPTPSPAQDFVMCCDVPPAPPLQFVSPTASWEGIGKYDVLKNLLQCGFDKDSFWKLANDF